MIWRGLGRPGCGRRLPGTRTGCPARRRGLRIADGRGRARSAADLAGGRYTVFHRSLRFAGWKLVRLVPASYYTTELRWIGLVNIGLVLACLVVAVVLSVLLSRVVSRPVGEIARAMERVGRRDFSATRARAYPGRARHGGRGVQRDGRSARPALRARRSSREREVQRATAARAALPGEPAPAREHPREHPSDGTRRGRRSRRRGMLATLSRLLRRTLSRTDDLVPLVEEIENLQDWIAVMQVRYLDRIDARIDVAPGLERRLVPPMVLQPLVENAVLHGLSARLNEEDGGAVLEVDGRRGGRLARAHGAGQRPGHERRRRSQPHSPATPRPPGPDGSGAIGIAECPRTASGPSSVPAAGSTSRACPAPGPWPGSRCRSSGSPECGRS